MNFDNEDGRRHTVKTNEAALTLISYSTSNDLWSEIFWGHFPFLDFYEVFKFPKIKQILQDLDIKEK